MKKIGLGLILCAMLFVTACQPLAKDPLLSAMTTLVPGGETELHSPIAQEGTGDTVAAVLYFRFLQEDLLAQESRKITVPKNESLEKALVKALLQGPGASSPELRRLFSSQVQVLSAISQGQILYVTLSEAVLSEPMENRFLQMQSLCATLVENCGYEAVQILVDQKSEQTTSLRLAASFFNPADDGAAPPLYRDEAYLLGPGRTLETILESWKKKDYERVYTLLAMQDTASMSVRPQWQTALREMDGGLSLVDYKLFSGTVSPDGKRAVVNCDMTLLMGTMEERILKSYPLTLLRENGIWKMRYQDFIALVYRP